MFFSIEKECPVDLMFASGLARAVKSYGPAGGDGVSRRPRLTVLGSINMDVSVTLPRLPVPGETLLGSAALLAPGGKGANQAVAAARLGGAVRMIGCTGDDEFARTARSALAADDVDVSAVRAVAGTATGLALIMVGHMGENTIAVAPGANAVVAKAEIAAALSAAADILVLSAEIPVVALTAVLAAGPGARPACLLNLAPAPPDAAALVAGGADWLVVNESEAAAVLGRTVAGLAEAGQAARDLCRLGARHAVVTAGSHGAVLAGPSGEQACPAFSVASVDTVGAGDAFVAALAVAVAAGVPDAEALRAACAAGATATTRRGTQDALPRPADILAATGLAWPVAVS
jgi:ribokinase